MSNRHGQTNKLGDVDAAAWEKDMYFFRIHFCGFLGDDAHIFFFFVIVVGDFAQFFINLINTSFTSKRK